MNGTRSLTNSGSRPLILSTLISGKYFFVNRQGFKVREMTADELAAGLRSGEVRTVDETPILDKALDRLMSKAAAVA